MSKYRSDIARTCYLGAVSLHKAGLLSDEKMHEYEVDCLTEIPEIPPKKIQQIRVDAKLSQERLASLISVTTGAVSKWERGEKFPSGPAVRLLQLIQHRGLEPLDFISA